MSNRPWGLYNKRISKTRIAENKRMENNANFKFDEKNRYLDKDGNPVLITVLPTAGKPEKKTVKCKG